MSAGAEVRRRAARPARTPRAATAVERNALITHTAAAVLTILLLAEGLTLLNMHGLLHAHMFIGLVLIPPVLLKLGSTGYRFARYYTGAPAYREKGPPRPLLRVLAPVLVATTALIFVSGVWLLLLGHHSDLVLTVHKVSFIVWSGIFGVALPRLPPDRGALARGPAGRRPDGIARRGGARPELRRRGRARGSRPAGADRRVARPPVLLTVRRRPESSDPERCAPQTVGRACSTMPDRPQCPAVLCRAPAVPALPQP